MSHRTSWLERKAPGDEPDPEADLHPRRRLALGTIVVLNIASALIAWAVGLAALHVGQALLRP